MFELNVLAKYFLNVSEWQKVSTSAYRAFFDLGIFIQHAVKDIVFVVQ